MLRKDQEKVNESLRYFEPLYKNGRKVNAVFLNANNSRLHEMVKCEVCYWLQFFGKSFITETAFKDCGVGVRVPDVVDLNDMVVYEVMASETDEKFDKKVVIPESFEVRKVSCGCDVKRFMFEDKGLM